jgi:GlpG protein
MRQIGTLEHESLALRFSAYLESQKIDNSIDASFDPNAEKASYAIWVHDEDHLKMAAAFFDRFQSNPTAAEFNAPLPESVASRPIMLEEEEMVQRKPSPRLTSFWIFLCVLAYFFNAMQEIPLIKAGFKEDGFLMTPIRFKLLYDVPPALDRLEPVIEKQVLGSPQPIEEATSENQEYLAVIEQSSYWRGIYQWVQSKVTGENTTLGAESIFFKIRQGQIWRLFSPCILHGGLLHIAFNMLWLWVLGKEIDPRIGISRSLILTLSAGIISNTVQYLMSGPFFLGYSGVITGLAGFIWSRQKIAPWEGYPLKRSMLLFLAIYIVGLFALQIGSFIVLLVTHQTFFSNIANSAHISGAIWGLCMGRLPFFAARARSA